jgi:hypothetical protein
MRSNRTRVILALAAAFSIGDAHANEGGATADAMAALQGKWCWGSQYRSANVPFLRVIARNKTIAVETKHYMHSNFVANTKDVAVGDNRIAFTYWYEPLARWARCVLTLGGDGDTMAGDCDGELGAGLWGRVSSHLWRC